jgi:hypothetical protein
MSSSVNALTTAKGYKGIPAPFCFGSVKEVRGKGLGGRRCKRRFFYHKFQVPIVGAWYCIDRDIGPGYLPPR